MQEIVQTGRTVDEAVALALAALDADPSEVAVAILNKGRQGFLGIGGEMAEVRVTRHTAAPTTTPDADANAPATDADAGDSDADADGDSIGYGGAAAAGAGDTAGYAAAAADSPGDSDADTDAAPSPAPTRTPTAATPAEAALHSVERILQLAGADVDVALRSDYDEAAGGPVIDIAGPDSGLLIGRRGNTLQSLQFIVQSIIRQQFQEEVRVSLDVEQYRQRREDSLREMADRVANRVAQTGRGITLEPMTPSDRRVIHVYLSDRDDIRTESIGYGEGRKVQIIPDRG